MPRTITFRGTVEVVHYTWNPPAEAEIFLANLDPDEVRRDGEAGLYEGLNGKQVVVTIQVVAGRRPKRMETATPTGP